MSGFPRWHSGNEFTCQCKRLKRCKRSGFNTCVVKIPWEGNGNPLQYSCLKFHVQRSLAGYSSWDCEESDTTEHTHITLHYVMLHYITLHMYVTTASWRENSELWLHESLLSFLLPGSQMWQQSSFDLADEYNDLIGREQQYARELHPWMISWSKIPTQANSEGTITRLLSCSNCCLNELFLQWVLSPCFPAIRVM